jgi:hypothetical protein
MACCDAYWSVHVCSWLFEVLNFSACAFPSCCGMLLLLLLLLHSSYLSLTPLTNHHSSLSCIASSPTSFFSLHHSTRSWKFSLWGRLWAAVLSNLYFFLVFVVYLLAAGGFTNNATKVVGFIMAMRNTYGVLLIICLLVKRERERGGKDYSCHVM